MKKWVLPLLCGLLLPLTATAENSTQASGYTIHHNAIPTATLTPAVATGYRITRSKYRGLLNVSVIKEVPGTTGQPVTAIVRANATNLLGKSLAIPMREIREGAAVYYIGEFPIIDRETLSFKLEVTPAGMQKPISAALSQQFFVD